MPNELIFIAFENIKQVSHIPRLQIETLIQRIIWSYQDIKKNKPDALCICSWHENSISGLDDNCLRTGICTEDNIYLKNEIAKLAHEFPDLYIIANATVDKPIKSSEDLNKIKDLYTLHYDVRDEEKEKNYTPLFLDHEKSYTDLVEKGFSDKQQKRVISGFYFHGDSYLRHDKCYPWKESYNPFIIWQPPKQKYSNPFVTIEDRAKDFTMSCQLALCRELSFAKGKTDLLVVMSNHIPVKESHAHLADIIFHVDSHYSELYLTPSYLNQYEITFYSNNVSTETPKLVTLNPKMLNEKNSASVSSPL